MNKNLNNFNFDSCNIELKLRWDSRYNPDIKSSLFDVIQKKIREKNIQAKFSLGHSNCYEVMTISAKTKKDMRKTLQLFIKYFGRCYENKSYVCTDEEYWAKGYCGNIDALMDIVSPKNCTHNTEGMRDYFNDKWFCTWCRKIFG